MLPKKLIPALCLSCVLALLASCAYINTQMNAKTLKGDKNVAETETALPDDATYGLIIEDVNFSGVNATGKIVIDDSLDRKIVLKTDTNIADTISVSVNNGKITVKGDKAYRYERTDFEIRIGAKVDSFEISGGFSVDVNQPSIASFSGHVDGPSAPT